MTKPADRDAAVDRLLRSTRTDPPAAADGVCLDADTLAAWADGTLPAAVRTVAEGHAASCARCQALLAAMIRTEPPRAAAVSRWTPWPFFRWAVPLSAAAVAAALWISVDRGKAPEHATEFVAPAPAPAQPRAETATAAAPRPTDTPLAKDSRSSETFRDRGKPQTARAQTKTVDRVDRKEASAEAPQALAETVTVGPPLTPPAAKPTPTPPPPEPVPAPAAPTSVAETVSPQSTRTPSARTVTTAKESVADVAIARRAESRLRSDVAQPAWTEVTSPDPLVRWRFAPRGDIERTTDGGVTWTPDATRVGIITSGSAPSSTVCWLAGRAGLVLRFTTGRGWQRLTLPAARDVIAIQASSADAATVTFEGGVRLTTTDGGATWSR